MGKQKIDLFQTEKITQQIIIHFFYYYYRTFFFLHAALIKVADVFNI